MDNQTQIPTQNNCCKEGRFGKYHKPLAVLAIILSVYLIVLSLSVLAGIKTKIYPKLAQNTIAVSGTGTIYAKPDLGIVNLTVTNQAKSAAAALKQNTEKINGVIAFVKNQEVEDKDIKTANFNIYPKYEYGVQPLYYPPGKQVFVGYEVSQTVEVKIRNLDNVGKILEGATAAGANNIGNLQLTIDKQDDLKNQARKEAIEQAKKKAGDLAAQLGLKLGKVASFSENSIFPYPMMEKAYGLGGGISPASAPQIEAGENKIEVTVNIVYEIN